MSKLNAKAVEKTEQERILDGFKMLGIESPGDRMKLLYLVGGASPPNEPAAQYTTRISDTSVR